MLQNSTAVKSPSSKNTLETFILGYFDKYVVGQDPLIIKKHASTVAGIKYHLQTAGSKMPPTTGKGHLK